MSESPDTDGSRKVLLRTARWAFWSHPAPQDRTPRLLAL